MCSRLARDLGSGRSLVGIEGSEILERMWLTGLPFKLRN
jgi:hypothetical protein